MPQGYGRGPRQSPARAATTLRVPLNAPNVGAKPNLRPRAAGRRRGRLHDRQPDVVAGHRREEDGVQAVQRASVGADLIEQMEWAEAKTAANERIALFVAFNYGGRAEILDAAARFDGGDEADFARLLYAPEMHDPDLVIRTSGERRLSNYLLWQSAYSELVFRDELWPDFTREAFEAALAEYGARERRFGGR